jgi:hypothetical protein
VVGAVNPPATARDYEEAERLARGWGLSELEAIYRSKMPSRRLPVRLAMGIRRRSDEQRANGDPPRQADRP